MTRLKVQQCSSSQKRANEKIKQNIKGIPRQNMDESQKALRSSRGGCLAGQVAVVMGAAAVMARGFFHMRRGTELPCSEVPLSIDKIR